MASVEIDETLPSDVWSEASIEVDREPEIASSPESGAGFASLPAELARPKTYAELASSLKDHLYRTRRLQLWRCAALKQTSRPGESEGDFRIRLVQAAHELRDVQVEKLRAKYAPKLTSLQDQVRRAEQRLEKEKEQSSGQTMQATISLGASILGVLFGRKLASSANVTRAASTARAASRAARERGDIAQAAETLGTLRERLSDLESQFEQDAQQVRDSCTSDGLTLEPLEIKPKKSEIAVDRVVLAWSPDGF